MAKGIIIHISVGKEKRTEFFNDERISFGADDNSDLFIHSPEVTETGNWFELENTDGLYRIVNFNENLNLTLNDKPISPLYRDCRRRHDCHSRHGNFFFVFLARFKILADNDAPGSEIRRASLSKKPRSKPRFRRNATMPKRFCANLSANFRARFRGRANLLFSFWQSVLSPEFCISATPSAMNSRRAANKSEKQNLIITKLEEKLSQTNDQIGELDKTNKSVIDILSLAPRLSSRIRQRRVFDFRCL